MKLTKAQSTKATIGCIALAILVMSNSTVSVGLGSMMADAHFANVPTTTIQLVVGLPSLVGIPVGLAAIPLARKFSCKSLLILVQAIFLISGVSVFFMTDINLILAMRALMGVGKGLYNPIIIAAISYIFEGDQRGRVLGFRSSASMAGGILMSLLGGFLAAYGWNYCYLIYAAAIPCAIIGIICLPSAKLPKPEKKEAAKIPLSKKLTPGAIQIIVMTFLVTCATHTSSANLSIHIVQSGLGTSAIAGICTSAMMICGVLAGMVVGRLMPKLKRFSADLGFICQAIGLLGTALAPSVPLIIAAQCFLGFALGTYEPVLQCWGSRASNPLYLTTVTTGIGFGVMFAQFISPYLITPLGDITVRFAVSAGVSVLLIILNHVLPRIKWFGTDYPADTPLPQGVEIARGKETAEQA